MVKAVTKVAYKPSTQSTEEFIMIVNPREYQLWKDGDTTIPLTEVVDSFKVFWSQAGHQGYLWEASKQQLENTFGTSKDIDVAQTVLKAGTMTQSERLDSDRVFKNPAAGNFTLDVRGSGARLSGA